MTITVHYEIKLHHFPLSVIIFLLLMHNHTVNNENFNKNKWKLDYNYYNTLVKVMHGY